VGRLQLTSWAVNCIIGIGKHGVSQLPCPSWFELGAVLRGCLPPEALGEISTVFTPRRTERMNHSTRDLSRQLAAY
jgi:hypothetical protein